MKCDENKEKYTYSKSSNFARKKDIWSNLHKKERRKIDFFNDKKII